MVTEGSCSGELSTYDAGTRYLITDVTDKVKVHHCQRVFEDGFPLCRGAEVKHVLVRGRDPPVGLVPAWCEKDIAGEFAAKAGGLREGGRERAVAAKISLMDTATVPDKAQWYMY